MPQLNDLFKTKIISFGLTKDTPVAIGVSGGGDSMALALLAADFFKSVTFLSVDHGLRAEAASETKQVKAWLADTSGTHVILTHAGVTPSSEGIQDWARHLRYALMEGWCKENGVEALFLAHHQGDQAETVLMRLMRGSGVDGLSGMREVSSSLIEPEGPNLYRPLLEVPKAQLLDYLNSKNQPWIEDPSNKNERFKRIQAREWLNGLPDSEQLIPRFSETASRFGRVKDLLDKLVDDAIKGGVDQNDNGTACFKKETLANLNEELGLRLLSRLVRAIGGNEYPARMEKLLRLYNAILSDGFTAATLGGVQFLNNKSAILAFREVADCEGKVELKPHQTTFWDGRFLATLEGKQKGNYHIGALEQKGWEQLIKIKPEVKESTLPHIARLSLATIWVKNEVIAVPSLDFLKEGGVSLSLRFRPRNPLIKG
jgi:tRNA(Ile)-lysidine synthase